MSIKVIANVNGCDFESGYAGKFEVKFDTDSGEVFCTGSTGSPMTLYKPSKREVDFVANSEEEARAWIKSIWGEWKTFVEIN